LGSNSYNFIELGWNGLLVEANPNSVLLLRETVTKLHKRLRTFEQRNGYIKDKPKIDIVHSLISAGIFEDRVLKLPLSRSPTSFGTGVNPHATYDGEMVEVPIVSALKLFQRYNVPKYFGVLTIDIEADTWDVAMDLLQNGGYRPQFLIMESHSDWQKSTQQTRDNIEGWKKLLESMNYVFAQHTNMNDIWRYKK